MDFKKILNDSTRCSSAGQTPGQFRPPFLPAISTTSNHSSSRTSSTSSAYFPRRDPLRRHISPEGALPRLSGSTSDESDSGRSPLTPSHTPETTRNLSFERDPKRHFVSPQSQRRPIDLTDRRDPSRSSPYRLTRQMDSFGIPLPVDYLEPNSFPSYAQPQMAHMSPPQVMQMRQQPFPELAHTVPIPTTSQEALPSPTRPATKQPRKNSYPCPVSKQYNCSEYFTTSGHAARHAKKHTGKKDAICPECQKAFTRKDNMEQHRRIHSSVKNSTRSTDDNRQRKIMKLQSNKRQSKHIATIPEAPQSDPELEQQAMSSNLIDPHAILTPDVPTMSILDPQLNTSPIQTSFPDDVTMTMPPSMYGMSDGIMAAPVPNMNMRHQLPHGVASLNTHNRIRSSASVSSPSTTSSAGFPDEPQSPSASLDMLAHAAASRLA